MQIRRLSFMRWVLVALLSVFTLTGAFGQQVVPATREDFFTIESNNQIVFDLVKASPTARLVMYAPASPFRGGGQVIVVDKKVNLVLALVSPQYMRDIADYLVLKHDQYNASGVVTAGILSPINSAADVERARAWLIQAAVTYESQLLALFNQHYVEAIAKV
jgi:hypothetical protein